MGDDDNHSYKIHINKPRVFIDKTAAVNLKKKIQKTLPPRFDITSKKPSERTLNLYSFYEDTFLKSNVLKKEEVLIPYKLFTKFQKLDKDKQRLAIHLTNKYKIINTDLRRRLYVKQPPDVVRTIMDVDEDFFHIVNGRPCTEFLPRYKSLGRLFREQLQMVHNVGLRRDCLINMDVNQRKQLEIYNLTLQKLADQANYFDRFISEDYKKSIGFLNEWEVLKKTVHLKIAELQSAASEEFYIASRIMLLDYMYGLQQKYGRFLYYLSPSSWRLKNRAFAHSVEIEQKGFDYTASSEDDTFDVIFEKWKKQCNSVINPVLYFTKSNELLNVFGTIEEHLLYIFQHNVTNISSEINKLTESIKIMKGVMKKDSASVVNLIRTFQGSFQASEDQCEHLKSKFFRILNGIFFESVASKKVLKLYLQLEFCVEKVYCERPVNVDIVNLAKSLESFYLDSEKLLEEIHSQSMHRAILKCTVEERRKMKRAIWANKELRLFNRLQRELMRSFNILPKSTGGIAAPPSRGPVAPAAGSSAAAAKEAHMRKSSHKKAPTQRTYTDAEMEYLRLFTEWTAGEDPAMYLNDTQNAIDIKDTVV